MSRAAAFALIVAAALSGRAVSAAVRPDEADDLYRHRDDLASAKHAADLWAEHASSDFDAAWKLARACYWLGSQSPEKERRPALDRGVTAARAAIRLEPNKPEGHFWLAANLGAIAEQSGLMQGLKVKGDIKSELERSIAIAPDWQEGSAEAALGRWYFEVPGWGFGGSKSKAAEILRGVLAKHPTSHTAMSFLADLLIADGKRVDARTMLQRLIDTPSDPEWLPEDENYKRQAEERLTKLK